MHALLFPLGFFYALLVSGKNTPFRHSIYYDFHLGKYSTDSGNIIPKPATPVIKKDFIDDKDFFVFGAFGLSKEEFKSYIEEGKSKGVTVDPIELDDFMWLIMKMCIIYTQITIRMV